MKTNKNITIYSVEVLNTKYDEEGNEYPVNYSVELNFYGKDYSYTFDIKDIKNYYLGWGLPNSACYGDVDLFDSADSYFEENNKAAEELVNMFKDAWDCWDCDDKYDFKGDDRNL